MVPSWTESGMTSGVRIAGAAMVAWLLSAGLLAGLERAMLYPAPDLPDGWLAVQARRQGARELALSAEDGTPLYGWHLPAGGRGAVVWFEGNGGSIGMREAEFARLRAAGWDVVQVNYRGYPGSGGEPSEAGLRQDARAAWAYARSVAPRAWIYGKSLGGGVAVGLASEVDPLALVVESTFTSAVDVGRTLLPWMPVGWLMRDRFPSEALAAKVRCPSLVLHGEADTLIPVAQGERLAAALRAEVVRFPGAGHDDPLLLTPRGWDRLSQIVGAP